MYSARNSFETINIILQINKIQYNILHNKNNINQLQHCASYISFLRSFLYLTGFSRWKAVGIAYQKCVILLRHIQRFPRSRARLHILPKDLLGLQGLSLRVLLLVRHGLPEDENKFTEMNEYKTM